MIHQKRVNPSLDNQKMSEKDKQLDPMQQYNSQLSLHPGVSNHDDHSIDNEDIFGSKTLDRPDPGRTEIESENQSVTNKAHNPHKNQHSNG